LKTVCHCFAQGRTNTNHTAVGDAFVRELEFSKITLRLVEKSNTKDDNEEHTLAKLTGDTYSTLQRILVRLPDLRPAGLG
jgi:Ca2+-dependent lipid-binding protein